ncbi:hypothetical protein [Enterovibrio baiacu]|uniref:hypothetical protein n=1 Tax=Enterovibrio baiacu TaxID=2491023 RepID=UPI0010135F15|nr:hypothetical protein [Enterovibrio baiacu]MBE1276106.1 hypothetical protein [Enterovibrio baiacu]
MVTIPKKQAALALAISSALALSACGGDDDSGTSGGGNIGGGSGGGTVQPGGVIITAMDGYLKNALLCADDNGNGICEASEIIKDTDGKVLLTDEDGHIDAKISQADEKRLETSARLIATVQSLDADSEVITEDMDLPGQAMKAVTLRAPAGSEIASPITDLVVSKMQSTETTEGLSKEDAEKAVAKSLGGLNVDGEVSTEILYSNYIEDKKSDDVASKALAEKIHKTAQILTETKATASSEEAFDKHLDAVVSATVETVDNIAKDPAVDINDPTLKPSLPVTDESVGEMVTNYAVQFNAAKVEELAGQVETLKDVYGDVDMWGDDKTIVVETAALVTDKDATADKANTISIANKTALRDANLAVTLASDTLTISRVNPEAHVAKGTYKIQLATNDLNSNGDVASEQVIATTTLDLTVDSFNYAPTLNQDIADAVAKDVKAVELEQHAAVNASFDVAELFSDKNGDVLKFSAKSTIPGIEASVNGTTVFLSGAPAIASADGKLVVSASDGVNKPIEYSFPFSPVTPVIANELRDLLVGENKTWYRWNGESEEITTPEGNATWRNYANCMAIKFVEGENKNSGITLLAEGEQCPSESSTFKQDGTWEANAEGYLIWTIPGEGDATLIGFVKPHGNDERQPRITVFEREKLVEVTKASNGKAALTASTLESGFTLFKGQVSANNYWNDSDGSVWLGKDVSISATSRHGQFTTNETQDHIDVDLFFDNMSCEELGFKADPNNTQFNGYVPADLRADYFRLIGEGTNGQWFDYGVEEGMKQPYAFQSTDSDGTKYCAVNLDVSKDYEHSTSFKSGQALTIYVSDKANTGDEEFIINTFIDRDFSIQPKEDLIISETGIFFVDGNSVSNVYRAEKGGKTVFLEQGMELQNGKWSDWSPFGDSQLITQYVAANGHHAYQLFNEGGDNNSDESFTIWSDAVNTMHGKDTGSDDVWDQKIFFSLEEAQAAVEAVLNSEISFIGSVWKETFITEDSESSDYAVFTYQNNGVSVTEYKNNVAGKAKLYPYNPADTDLPCRDDVSHTCTFEQLNKSYEFFDGESFTTWVKWEWDPITNPNKMWRHKGEHESEWVRLK